MPAPRFIEAARGVDGGCGLGGLLGGELRGGLALKGIEAVRVDPGDEGGVVLADDAPVDHHVDAVDLEMLEDARVVGDDDERAVGAFAVGVHAAGDHAEGVDVQTGVGLVQDGEFGLEQQQLQHLDLLLLTAGEAHAQFAIEVGGVHVELGG